MANNDKKKVRFGTKKATQKEKQVEYTDKDQAEEQHKKNQEKIQINTHDKARPDTFPIFLFWWGCLGSSASQATTTTT